MGAFAAEVRIHSPKTRSAVRVQSFCLQASPHPARTRPVCSCFSQSYTVSSSHTMRNAHLDRKGVTHWFSKRPLVAPHWSTD